MTPYVSSFQQTCREFSKPVEECTVDPLGVTPQVQPDRKWTPEECLAEDIRDVEERITELEAIFQDIAIQKENLRKDALKYNVEYHEKHSELARLKAKRDGCAK